jgi:hypothetical protein
LTAGKSVNTASSRPHGKEGRHQKQQGVGTHPFVAWSGRESGEMGYHQSSSGGGNGGQNRARLGVGEGKIGVLGQLVLENKRQALGRGSRRCCGQCV